MRACTRRATCRPWRSSACDERAAWCCRLARGKLTGSPFTLARPRWRTHSVHMLISPPSSNILRICLAPSPLPEELGRAKQRLVRIVRVIFSPVSDQKGESAEFGRQNLLLKSQNLLRVTSHTLMWMLNTTRTSGEGEAGPGRRPKFVLFQMAVSADQAPGRDCGACSVRVRERT